MGNISSAESKERGEAHKRVLHQEDLVSGFQTDVPIEEAWPSIVEFGEATFA